MNRGMKLFFDQEVGQLLDSFAYCFRVSISIFSADVQELITGRKSPEYRFCRMIQEKCRFRHRCIQQDKAMCKKAEARKGLVVYSCYTGLSEAVLPIYVYDTLIGYSIVGQFRTKTPLCAEIRSIWNKAGFDIHLLEEAFEECPFFDEKALNNMLNLFSMLINYIVTREYVTFRQPSLAEKAIQWIESHAGEAIDLDMLTRALGRSRSSVSHTLKKDLGMGFTQLCTQIRIRRFESIVNAEPDITVSEAAMKAGYEDPLYFSRVYKKNRFIAPSEYLRFLKSANPGAATPDRGSGDQNLQSAVHAE
ncbi:MAG: PocR ligand-binding domain-containing protein [Treponema sp.]|nr:PocR ligand-binding domain-containing protein [Treponema sp.]